MDSGLAATGARLFFVFVFAFFLQLLHFYIKSSIGRRYELQVESGGCRIEKHLSYAIFSFYFIG